MAEETPVLDTIAAMTLDPSNDVILISTHCSWSASLPWLRWMQNPPLIYCMSGLLSRPG